ncbi:DUF6678 family protein [Agrobacterium sp. CG674]
MDGVCQSGKKLTGQNPINHDIILGLKGSDVLNPVMNNTKWNELVLEMDELTPSPAWSTLSMNGHNYGPDRDWLYHFTEGGYEDIVYVDIHVETPMQRELVLSALRKVHVPGEETSAGFRVFGQVQNGQGVDYI